MARPFGSPAEPPVDLPKGVGHGGARAYNRYRCRCWRCLAWRRGYDRARYWLTKERNRRLEARRSRSNEQ